MPVSPPTFVIPDTSLYTSEKFGGYINSNHTYSYYNYFRPGILQNYKRRRFNISLSLAGELLFNSNAIDFGCADGPLLPTLSKYCKHVLAIDRSKKLLEVSFALKETLKLDNVKIVDNTGMEFDQLRETSCDHEFDIALILETMEHIGNTNDMYGSRAEFIKGVFSLLKPNGHVLVSVPRMVGPTFLAKYILQKSLGLRAEKFTLGELFKAGLLCNTKAIESQWIGDHKGFNNNEFRRTLEENFRIVKKKRSLITDFYLLMNK